MHPYPAARYLVGELVSYVSLPYFFLYPIILNLPPPLLFLADCCHIENVDHRHYGQSSQTGKALLISIYDAEPSTSAFTSLISGSAFPSHEATSVLIDV